MSRNWREPQSMAEGRRPGGGFTLIEVLAAMAVLVILVLALTRMFVQAADITKKGTTALMRNSTGETSMETLLQDAEGMMVNDRLACLVKADAADKAGFGFDEVWFISTAGDQDDDIPYEYFHYYVTNGLAKSPTGASYKRFSLIKDRMIFAVADSYGLYALDPIDVKWWNKAGLFSSAIWDRQVLADNVVRFDIYCLGWDGNGWMSQNGNQTVFDSTQGPNFSGGEQYKNVPPAAFDIYLQLTSPEVAMEGGMALLDPAMEQKGREMMIRESSSLFGRATPITGPARYNTVAVYGTNNATYYEN
jgi:prepilin-type N-terminal cleavage/methylation domain-containing protein